jgi:hypothetical protein
VERVAVYRMPKLQEFLDGILQLLSEGALPAHTELLLLGALNLFFTPNEDDKARNQMESAPSLLFPGSHLCRPGFGLGRVTHHYTPRNHIELSLDSGDEVDLKEQVGEFYYGQFNDRSGLVPLSHIDVVVPIPGMHSSKPLSRLPSTQAAPTSNLIDDLSPLFRLTTTATKPTTPTEELLHSERKYLESLVAVRDDFFPKLRMNVSAAEASILFQNWAEVISVSQVRQLADSMNNYLLIFMLWFGYWRILLLAIIAGA